jgi:hypothetical protein
MPFYGYVDRELCPKTAGTAEHTTPLFSKYRDEDGQPEAVPANSAQVVVRAVRGPSFQQRPSVLSVTE